MASIVFTGECKIYLSARALSEYVKSKINQQFRIVKLSIQCIFCTVIIFLMYQLNPHIEFNVCIIMYQISPTCFGAYCIILRENPCHLLTVICVL
jgi:hypothetical protein